MSDQHDGKCTCGHVRYRVHGAPMFVHCCHCRWCQRETGSAFALNAFVEAVVSQFEIWPALTSLATDPYLLYA
jgi:hypothetical protein